MKTLLYIAALTLAAMPTHSEDRFKSKALMAVKAMFQPAVKRLEIDGRYIDTAADYGETCKFVVDLSRPGHEYLVISGEYTPMTKTGDGVFFAEAEETFTDFVPERDAFTIEQTIEDSFSTWTKTTLTVSKNQNQVDILLKQTNSFLFFTDSVEKHCRAPLDAPAQPEQSKAE